MTTNIDLTVRGAFENNWSGDATSIWYDGKTMTVDIARERLAPKVETFQKIRDKIDQKLPLYVKLTQGSKAGTIGRLVIPDSVTITKQDQNIPATVKLHESSHRWRASTEGHVSIVGHYTLPSYWGRNSSDFSVEVDGKIVHTFRFDNTSHQTCRPILMLDYDGPEVYQRGRASKSKISNTIGERYGRKVTAGDLVIIAKKNSGALIVGKVEFITDKRTMTIKHIGADEVIKLPDVQDDQVLLLSDDIKTILMMEKLKKL